MTPEITCKNCRFGRHRHYDLDTKFMGETIIMDYCICHRNPDLLQRQSHDWCIMGEWKGEYGWTSWYDIMDMEEAITKELKRDWRGQE